MGDKRRADEGDPVFRWNELGAQALTPDEVRAQLAAARWSRPLPRVVVRSTGSMSQRERCLAALKYADGRGSAKAFVSHHTAAEWHRFGLEASPDVHVSVMGGAKSRDFVVVHRTASVPARHVIVVDGIRIASPARTLLDLSRGLRDAELTHLVARLIQRRIVRRGYLIQELAYLPRWPGAARLRAVLAEVVGKRSGHEVTVIAGLARRWWYAEANVGIEIPGLKTREGDAVFRAIRAVVQVESIEHHTLLPDAALDSWRDLDIARASYVTIPVWAAELDRNCDEVLDAVAEALEVRARELGVPLDVARGRPTDAPPPTAQTYVAAAGR